MQPIKSRVSGALHRIISTKFPRIDFFERHVSAEKMAALWALESRTNPRIKDKTGDLLLVDEKDRVSGPGASIIMAPFTHIGRASRFTNGQYGVYYASRTLDTSVHETVFHREVIARDASLPACDFSMRQWITSTKKYLLDIKQKSYKSLHNKGYRAADYAKAQKFGASMRESDAWGLLYNSVRHSGGECVAIFRPAALVLPTQGSHFVYSWNGNKVTTVYKRGDPLFEF